MPIIFRKEENKDSFSFLAIEEGKIVSKFQLTLDESIKFLEFLGNQLKEETEVVELDNVVQLPNSIAFKVYKYFSNTIDAILTDGIIGYDEKENIEN